MNPNSEDAKKELKNVFDIQMKLLKETYVNGLISTLKHMFYDKDIMEKLDNQTHLLGFEDGVYDLSENVFREGRPEDYITMSTKIELLEYVDKKEKEDILRSSVSLEELCNLVSAKMPNYLALHRDMEQFITQIIPDIDVRNYIYRWMSKCLSGENRDEGFYMWT